MKKIGSILLSIFSVGILLCLLAGGFSVVGYLIALCIGGEMATEICVFIYKQYFPWVIRFSTCFCACGLLGMYLNKISALTVSSNSEENK